MTNEEAVKAIKSHCYFANLVPVGKEALDMAIKALEQQPCEDAISRQEVIETLKELDWNYNGHPGGEVYGAINKLPPVQSKPKIGHWIVYEVRLSDRTILNYRCSVCGRKLIGYNTETLSEAPFCHCGARMVESQESEE